MIFALNAAEDLWLMKKAAENAMHADTPNAKCEFIRMINTNKSE